MQLDLRFNIKEVNTILYRKYPQINIEIKTDERMKRNYIDTLLKFTNLKDCLKNELSTFLENNKEKIDIWAEKLKTRPFMSNNVKPYIHFQVSGKSIIMTYYFGNNLDNFKAISNFGLNQLDKMK